MGIKTASQAHGQALHVPQGQDVLTVKFPTRVRHVGVRQFVEALFVAGGQGGALKSPGPILHLQLWGERRIYLGFVDEVESRFVYGGTVVENQSGLETNVLGQVIIGKTIPISIFKLVQLHPLPNGIVVGGQVQLVDQSSVLDTSPTG